MADVLAGMGRMLLGANQASHTTSKSTAYRSWEGALFQAGMICLAVGYTTCFWLSVKHNLYRYVMMAPGRLLMVVGHILLCIWGATNNSDLLYMDYTAWNAAMAAVNLIQLIMILCAEKPIVLDASLDRLWSNVFGPEHYNLDKMDFYNLVQERAGIQSLRTNEAWFVECDEPGSLSILVDGKMTIYKKDDWNRREVINPIFNEDSNKAHQEMICGEVNNFEFLDSFEYLAHGLEHHYAQVTIKAAQDSILVYWNYESLKEVFKDCPRLRACIMALVGKDIATKLLAITGRRLRGPNEWCDVVRRKDHPGDCWREAGVKDITLTMEQQAPTADQLEAGVDANGQPVVPSGEAHPPFDMGEIIARLRIANARMLALVPSPLENLEPSAGVSSNPEHGAKLLNFFRRVVPDLAQRDLHELIKWGKWREYRKQFTFLQKKGEHPYYLGVLLDGQLDVLDEDDYGKLEFQKSIKGYELIGSEEFGSKSHSRSKRTIRVASHGAVVFAWDVKDLTRLMLADPRVESVISTLLRGDITLKLRDSQSLANRACGDIDAMRRDGEGRPVCGPAYLT